MEDSRQIVEFGPCQDGRTYWVTRGGAIRSAEPGGQAQTEFQLEQDVLHAAWCDGQLLVRTKQSLERWSAAFGNETVLSGLAPPPEGDALALHPREGFFGTTLPRRACLYRPAKTVIFQTDSDIVRLLPCDSGDYLSVLCKDGLETFETITGNSLGVMNDAIGGWILWDGLLVCQVDNPRGTGLMVVDLKASKLIQGGPSGYRAFEKFALSSDGNWLIGVSPEQQLIVGWMLRDGCHPTPRWESRHEGLTDVVALPGERLLVLTNVGAPVSILDHLGETVRQVPLNFRGSGARMLNQNTLAAMDGESLRRWNIQNGEGVVYR